MPIYASPEGKVPRVTSELYDRLIDIMPSSNELVLADVDSADEPAPSHDSSVNKAELSWLPTEPALSAQDCIKVRQLMADCVEGHGGEVSALARAVQLGEAYLRLVPEGRLQFLRLIVDHLGCTKASVDAAIASYMAQGDHGPDGSNLTSLRKALIPPWIYLIKQFAASTFEDSSGIQFLVELRGDLLGFLKHWPRLKPFDADLLDTLTTILTVGSLRLEQLTWNTSAAVLNKLIQYEAVHKIHSWTDLQHRLEGRGTNDRRIYGYFHEQMPKVPLIFVEVAFVKGLSSQIQRVLDVHHQAFNRPEEADTCIFYSIANTQAGLRGASFGNFLIKNVVKAVKADLPHLTTFATLSPIPKFRHWLMNELKQVPEQSLPLWPKFHA
ncbi:hypothetical protein CYMTET_15731 [Cymbomonas tetramitiformis]|uniref:Malonyl-CoA decarboxylase n=1 Tax=Cymbomonas tetramitiformis TaxID=36881 RepID=A0AAE0L8M6_9CHLO|nr:hypothetical protein CYMTET_15731 [Cymbomonas tetramitiformis]